MKTYRGGNLFVSPLPNGATRIETLETPRDRLNRSVGGAETATAIEVPPQHRAPVALCLLEGLVSEFDLQSIKNFLSANQNTKK